jgi:23S rRNA (cytosine1962-C5)-methyltransferase
MITLQLLAGTHKRQPSHPWIYRNQLADLEAVPDDQASGSAMTGSGQLVEVRDSHNRFWGIGVYNPRSMIAVRLLTCRRETVDDALIRSRIEAAVAYRRAWLRPDTDSYRMIFAEADRLPGVIADLFADTLVLQILSLGMERWLDLIVDTLIRQLRPANLILQHEEPIRIKEGLPLYRRVCLGQDPGQVRIRENGLAFIADLTGGQKTGCFLDQKENHAWLRPFTAGRTVLDCFAYGGGFALNALAGGASQVTAVDLSADAVRLIRTNADLNGLPGQLEIIEANVFDYLRQSVTAGRRYDVVVLDPPAFAKNHAALAAACRGYKEINLSALRLLPPGGILATHSCSWHMRESLFLDTVLEAAADARRIVRILAMRRQDFDHPVLAGYPESHYLKSLWLQVVE